MFKDTRAALKAAGKDLDRVNQFPLSHPERLVRMDQLAQDLRKAARAVELAAQSERDYTEKGFSLYQIDFQGEAHPVPVP